MVTPSIVSVPHGTGPPSAVDEQPTPKQFVLPTERIPDHKRYRPLHLSDTVASGVRTIRYRTVTGQEFNVTQDTRDGLIVTVQGLGLQMMSCRGVTQDSPWFTSGQGFNRAHLVANEFGGSGYLNGANLATTSAHYNHVEMRDAERIIGRSVGEHARLHTIDRGKVRFNLTVSVRFGAIRDPVTLAKIKEQLSLPADAGNDLDAEILAKLQSGEVHTELLRVLSVSYTWTFVEPEGPGGSTQLKEDLWLLSGVQGGGGE